MIIALLERQLEASNSTILSLQNTIKSLQETIKNLEELLRSKDTTLAKAKSQLSSTKALYAPKQSERQTSIAQVPVLKSQEELAMEEQRRKEALKARGNNGAKRKEYFEVETIEKDIYPKGIEPGLFQSIGISDVIRYSMIPPRFRKIIYHVHKVKTAEGILSGKAPLSPIHHSNFDGSFIAGIAQLRYLYSMPVERIVNYFNENGFEISKQTAHGLLKKTADIFGKLHKALGVAVKESRYLNCDETYHTVLTKDSSAEGKGSRRGYIWVAASQESGLCYFFYNNGSRGQDIILEKMKGYKGVIQSDGLMAYKNLEKQNSDIVRAACLQHCKRPFLEDDLKNNPDAQKVIELANALYHHEHKHCVGEDGWTVEDNLQWRREYAPAILAELKTVLLRIRKSKKYPPGSKIVKAANYFLNEWDGIEAISRYGDVSWDNNFLERLNRYVSLSRHNSLFFGSHAGAERGCFFYSLACSCRLNKVNFFEYLSDVLNKAAALPQGSGVDAYRDLLPDRWNKTDSQ